MAYLADTHTHSLFSEDGELSVADMLAQAQTAGLSVLGVSDHRDPSPRPEYRFAEIAAALQAARTRIPEVELLHAMELGDPQLDPAWARAALGEPGFDYVIVSCHVVGGHDFYAETHRGEDQCHALLRDYLELQRSYFGYGRFEILGHLGYPLRYMARDGFFPDLSRHTDLLAALFDDLIRHDAALEVNTSPLYGPLGKTNPDETVLRLYYDLGGRLVTLGSDAHRPGQIGRGLPEAHAMLKRVGFTHQAVYRKRERRLEAL